MMIPEDMKKLLSSFSQTDAFAYESLKLYERS